MAVPKKKKSRAATARQHHAYVTSQQKKLLGMVDRAIRNKKGRDFIEAEKAEKSLENVTVVQA